MFSLEVARCFGACGLAPTLSIDNEVYKRVRPAMIAGILVSFKRAGRGKGASHAA